MLTTFIGLMARDSKQRNTGFTFLEVLITIILLVVGMVAIIQVFSVGTVAEAEVDRTTTAVLLAQETMEEIRNVTYVGIDGFASARTSLTGDFADFDREVTISGDPKQVNVTVYWTASGVDQMVNVVSLFADYD